MCYFFYIVNKAGKGAIPFPKQLASGGGEARDEDRIDDT